MLETSGCFMLQVYSAAQLSGLHIKSKAVLRTVTGKKQCGFYLKSKMSRTPHDRRVVLPCK
jgi:hypothetical protein